MGIYICFFTFPQCLPRAFWGIPFFNKLKVLQDFSNENDIGAHSVIIKTSLFFL